jgi:outer membrane protein assembly factor BamB
MSQSSKRFLLSAVILVGCALPLRVNAGEDGSAGAILKVAEKSVGLCLHLGCGSAPNSGLTAELAGKSGMLVHGLALDDASLLRARKDIAGRGVAGRAVVEKLYGKGLPYLDGLARLVVVEDMAALGSRGIDRAEIMRVLAPGGKLCVLAGGKWSTTVKPRPKGMDEWTHPHHGADGNMVSSEKGIGFPLGLRWIDGVPFSPGGCGGCRAVALVGGRCLTISIATRQKKRSVFLKARDAYSGFPLWQLDCQGAYHYFQLDWRNVWPLVATEAKVYTKRGKNLIIVNAATGKVESSCKTKYEPFRLLLANQVLLTACWEKMETSKGKLYCQDSVRSVWWPAGRGSIEAFDPENGKPKWSLPIKALTLVASGKTAYALTHEGNPPTKRELIAIDLATGKEKWRVPHTAFGSEPDTCLNFAGPGCVVISKTKRKGKREVFVLAEADGRIMTRIPNSTARSLVGTELWCNTGRYDLKTGKKKPGCGVGGAFASINVVGGCVPPLVIGKRYITASRGGNFVELPADPKSRVIKRSYRGARGACLVGMIPANGMLYIPQNNCTCWASQIGGFLAVGPSAAPPGEQVFKQPRPIEKGPAFGASGPRAAPGDWPTYRGNSERSGGAASTGKGLPTKLKQLWKTQCVKPGVGQFATAWNSRIGAPQPLTAPIIAGGKVFLAGLDSAEVMALDAATGARLWKTALGGRIDTPPTYHKGLLIVGCHNGWVYALRATDGALAYRVRIAPLERRMVANGSVESHWPATGSILIHKDIAYATAGRSTHSSGGIAAVAFMPETGKTVWARNIGMKYAHGVDLFAIRRGELAFKYWRFDPKTGADLPPAQKYYHQYPMINGSWSAGFSKRSRRGFSLGRACNNMMAWNEKLVIFSSIAIDRAKIDCPKPGPKSRPKHPIGYKKEDRLWTTNLEPRSGWTRVNAMALAPNAALYTGHAMRYLRPENFLGNFLWVKSAKDGSTRGEVIKLPAPAAFDSIAIAGGRVYISLQDGNLICLGK